MMNEFDWTYGLLSYAPHGGRIWVHGIKRNLWNCLTQTWVDTYSIKLSIRLLSFALSIEVHPVFAPFQFSLKVKSPGWLISEALFNLWIHFGFIELKLKVGSSWSSTKDLIDRGVFYRYNTAPWSKGERQDGKS